MFGIDLKELLEPINRIGRALERLADSTEEAVRLLKRQQGDGK